MGAYADFVMKADGEPVAGVCHARGLNADLPALWLVYITDDDLDHSIAECQRLGGSVIAPPRSLGGGRFCVIKDPAGAVAALYQPPDAASVRELRHRGIQLSGNWGFDSSRGVRDYDVREA